MIEPHNAFATIAEVIDVNHYGVVTHWGQRIEAVYYRTGVQSNFVPGEHIFMERVKGSQLWMIIGHARGNPSGPHNVGWFEVDHAIYGVVDGPGRIMP